VIVDERNRAAHIAALIQTLHDTEQQLEALTAGQVDTVADPAGRVLVLRAAQEQLRYQEACKQAALLNALPAHVALLDASGVIIAVNDAWRRFADDNGLRDADHGVGRNYLEACRSTDDADAAQAQAVATGLRAVLAGECASYSTEYPCNSPVERRTFLLTATRLEAGRQAGAVVMHINVSDRARAERASRRSTELLQAVADGTPDVVYIKDTAGRYLLCNNALAQFTGRPVEQIIGRDDLELYGAVEAAQLTDKDRALFADGAEQVTEKWLTGVRGRRIFNSMRAPYRDSRGAVIGVIGIARDVTDARRAQEALRDSEAMLDMAGRIAKVGGWTLDMDSRRLYWSDIVAALHDEPAGFSPTLEDGISSFVPEYRAGVREAVERCAGEGVPYDIEAEKISSTGRRFWVRTMGEAVRDGEGRIVRIQGALQDITDRKLAMLETQRLELRLTNTLEGITDGFFTLDRDWRFTYVNREALRLLDKDRDALLGQVMWDVYPDARGRVFQQNYERAMAGHAGVSFEAHYPPLKMWIGIDCHPSSDGLSVYFRDVTARRAARLQLQLLEASVAQLNDIVIVCEAAPELARGLRIVFVNHAFERASGYTREEVLGRSPDFLNGPLTDHAELARVHGAIGRFESVHAELLQYTKRGDPHWVEVDVTPVAVMGEGRTHFVSIKRDISARRQNEEAMRQLNAGLEDRVRHRTLELEKARELAEQANRTKSSFLATMSHEIRTPMNGVVGMIDVLEESRLRPDQRDMVQTVRESACALLAIVDDVLDFSKIEAGQFIIDREPMDVAVVVESVCDALGLLSDKQGVALYLYTDPRLPTRMLGDAARLRQILMNLVGNAIKFSHGQGRPGVISLRAVRVVSNDADALELIVRDNGIGMEVETVGRLFSPFTQADASTTRRFGGTGLGLSISHRLVAMMDGQIAVNSEPGQGSTFTVRLPMVLPPATDSAALAPLAPLAHATALTGLPCLLIGDAARVADLADYLVHAGSVVRCSSTSAGAARWLLDVGTVAQGVVIIAEPADRADAALAHCRAAARSHGSEKLTYILIETGRRRRLRRQTVDQVSLDGECLHRSVFLRSVASAAGLQPAIDCAECGTRREMDAVPLDLSHRPAPEVMILVAEDNEINQKVLAKQLDLLGYRAEMAANGLEALACWRRGGHALLLTDLHMPEMDGYTLAAAVRAQEAGGARLPIIALTANALRDEEVRCRQAGMDGYLSKPVRLAQLKAAIESMLPTAAPRPLEASAPWISTGAPPPADLQVLVDLVGDDAQVIREVLNAFRATTTDAASEFAHAHARGAMNTLADLAHKLKSAARAIGAAQLGQICEDIEACAAGTPRAPALAGLLASFAAELRSVDAYLATQ
jgi:PAS domain S-box-containing protein